MLSGIKFIGQDELRRLEQQRPSQHKEKPQQHRETESGVKKGGVRENRHGKRRRREDAGTGFKFSPLARTERAGDAWDRDRSAITKSEKRRKKGQLEGRPKAHRGSESSDGSGSEDDSGSEERGKGGQGAGKARGREREGSDEGGREGSRAQAQQRREAAGLDWMTKAPERPMEAEPAQADKPIIEDPERPRISSRELNPYWTSGDGAGFPPEAAGAAQQPARAGAAGVGDGGASWRRKALKRAQEQAAREGKQLGEVVGDRWGTLAELTAGLGAERAAPAFAHKFASRERERRLGEGAGSPAAEAGGGRGEPGLGRGRRAGGELERGGGREEEQRGGEGAGEDADEQRMRSSRREYLKEVKSERGQMRMPQADSLSLSWRRGSLGQPAERRTAEAAHRRNPNPDLNPAQKQRQGEGAESFPKEARSQEGSEMATRVEARAEGRGGGGAQAEEGPGEGARLATEGRPEVGPAVKQRALAALDALASLGPEEATRDGDEIDLEDEAEEPAAQAAQEPAMQTGDKAAATPAGGMTANQAAARAMKLRLMGKHREADALQRQAAAVPREVVQLPLVDGRGRAVAGAFGNVRPGGAAGAQAEDRRPKPVQRYDASSEQKGPSRARYYADDDGTALHALVAQQRHGAAEEDYAANLAENIARNPRFKAMPSADDEYDHDMGLEMAEARSKQGSRKQQMQRQAAAQRSDHERMGRYELQCQLCFDSASRPRHLVVALGLRTYLMLPPRGRLMPGHCFICTMQHEGSTRAVDEEVWEELRNFKKCLLKMFAQQGREALFMETAVALNRQKRHCFVEAMPLPPAAARQAPLYFKKAIDEAEDEWSQHDAKKLLDTRGKGLRASIPKNFPYFHVEFGLQGGYCHVIDDESSFKATFGRDVVAGMLELPPEDTCGRQRAESVGQQQRAVAEFAKMWEPHDWTKMLE